MPTRAGRVLLAGLAAAAVLAVSNLAWACIPQPNLVTVQPRSSGPAGTRVTLAGLGFDPGRAEIRWNAADGQLLASANGPDFSVPVTIPQAADGLYHLIVLSRSAGGAIGNTSAVSFQVTAAGDVPAITSSPPTQSLPREDAGAPTRSISAAAVMLAAGVGALAALGCLGVVVVFRRRRTGPTLSAAGRHGP